MSYNDASDFYGAMVGPSQGVSLWTGVNHKVFGVKRKGKKFSIQNIVYLPTMTWGPEAEISPMKINGGAIAPLELFLKSMGKQESIY